MIGISADDPLDKLAPFVKQMKMTYPVLQGLGKDNVQDAYGPMVGLPVTVMISRDGKICSKHVGYGEERDVRERDQGVAVTTRRFATSRLRHGRSRPSEPKGEHLLHFATSALEDVW